MRRIIDYAVLALSWLACASQAQTTTTALPLDPQAALANLQIAMQDLPAGPGKELTAAACTRCHNLNGLPAYKGYWSRAQWQAMVENMVKHGAVLDAVQMKTVTDYLNHNYGRQSGPP